MQSFKVTRFFSVLLFLILPLVGILLAQVKEKGKGLSAFQRGVYLISDIVCYPNHCEVESTGKWPKVQFECFDSFFKVPPYWLEFTSKEVSWLTDEKLNSAAYGINIPFWSPTKSYRVLSFTVEPTVKSAFRVLGYILEDTGEGTKFNPSLPWSLPKGATAKVFVDRLETIRVRLVIEMADGQSQTVEFIGEPTRP